MISTSTTHKQTRFRDHRLLQILVAAYALVWVITAIQPLDRKDWLLENLLVLALVAILVARIARSLRISPLIIAFMTPRRGRITPSPTCSASDPEHVGFS
jgi:hypothetical protein